MKLPIIFVVDDDPQVLKSIVRDLRSAYKESYRIISTESAEEGLDALHHLKKKNEVVALYIVDQRMPEMLGVDFLSQGKEIFPDAKKVLLTAYSDTEAAIKAINEVQLDYYFLKPWDPPEEKLYPVLEGLLDDWKISNKPDFKGIKLIGYQFSSKSHQVKDFLAGNLIPYKWYDVQRSGKAKAMMEENGCDMGSLPLIIFEEGDVLCNPDLQEIAKKIGLRLEASKDLYDVIIIGAGPAGLAAAVYGGSEGLRTLLIEKHSPGGQAGTSSRIENYLGFPNGLSGAELTRRALAQVTRFGVEFLAPQEVTEIELKGYYKILTLTDGTQVKARSIIITTGVNYKQLKAKGVDDFTGAGIYYGAAMTEAPFCKNRNIYIVGGGNSAGQGAVYLSQYAKTVHILIRKDSLKDSMSQYLIEQINNTENITIHPFTEVEEAIGNDKLDKLKLKNVNTGEEQVEENVSALFIFIGAKPYTEWLPINIIKDSDGFIETGRNLKKYDNYSEIWKLDREPYLLETCTPGIFAAGDVRSGAMNRVASAVGEGAMAIKFVHQYLSEF